MSETDNHLPCVLDGRISSAEERIRSILQQLEMDGFEIAKVYVKTDNFPEEELERLTTSIICY